MPLGSCIVSDLHPSDMYKRSLPNFFSATTNKGNRHIVIVI